MRNVLVPLAIASASLVAVPAVVAAPAAAQGYYGGYHGGYPGGHGHFYPGDRNLVHRFESQISRLQDRIERLGERRAISPGEYRALHRHAFELRRRLFRFARNGLSRGEVQDIADRIDNLRDRIRDERRDGRRFGW